MCIRFFFHQSIFSAYRKYYGNLASSNADNVTFCTVLPTSQVVMIQSLQPKGRAYECVLFYYLYSFCLSSLIIDVPIPLSNDIWIILFQMVDA